MFNLWRKIRDDLDADGKIQRAAQASHHERRKNDGDKSGLASNLVCWTDGRCFWPNVIHLISFVGQKDLFRRDSLYALTLLHVHQLCMQHKLWEPALLYGERAVSAVKKYQGENSRSVAALLVRCIKKIKCFLSFCTYSIGEAAGRNGQLQKAKINLKEADQIFKEISGPDYASYKDQIYKIFVSSSRESKQFVRF